MKILCLSAPLAGHLDWGGYLPTVSILKGRGHDVLWASGTAAETLVRQAGVDFYPLAETGWRWPPPPPLTQSDAPSPEAWQNLRVQRALDQWLEVERVERAVLEVIALIDQWQPDLLVSEMFVAAAALAAEIADIPFVVAGWPAQPLTQRQADPMVDQARGRLHQLLDSFSIRGRNWTKSGPPALLSPDLHISYWSQRWFAGSSLMAQTQHVGGLPERPLLADASLPSYEDRPWVLITLGTSFGNDPNFFSAAAHAADRMGCLPLLALGGQINESQIAELRPRLPACAVLRQHVDFRAVLPYCATAIHHGGAGTTHALVTNGVPQIIVPHAADQQRQAHGVMRSGVGLAFAAKDVTVDVLVDALAVVLPDLAQQRQAAQELQAEFAALGGVVRAAELIEGVKG